MNPMRGEVDFGGRVMRYTTNAICSFEGRAGKKFGDAIAELEGTASFETMRLIVWAGLLADDPRVTVEQAGDAMDEVGLETAMKTVGDAVRAAFPFAATKQEKKAPSRRNG